VDCGIVQIPLAFTSNPTISNSVEGGFLKQAFG
jgi:hypothetical protein